MAERPGGNESTALTHPCTCGTEANPDEHASWGMCGWCHARLMREVAAERHDEWWGEVPA